MSLASSQGQSGIQRPYPLRLVRPDVDIAFLSVELTSGYSGHGFECLVACALHKS